MPIVFFPIERKTRKTLVTNLKNIPKKKKKIQNRRNISNHYYYFLMKWHCHLRNAQHGGMAKKDISAKVVELFKNYVLEFNICIQYIKLWKWTIGKLNGRNGPKHSKCPWETYCNWIYKEMKTTFSVTYLFIPTDSKSENKWWEKAQLCTIEIIYLFP